MIRLKIAVAAAGAGRRPGRGLAMPPAASADTAPVVYAWGNNNYGQAGVDPNVPGRRVPSPVPVRGAAANVTQLSGSRIGYFVLSLRSDGHGVGLGRQLVPRAG